MTHQSSTLLARYRRCTGAYGINGDHFGIGDLDMDVRNATIVTESTALDSTNYTLSYGIVASHRNLGDSHLDVHGGSITTKGVASVGIYGNHSGTGTGDMELDVWNATIVTESIDLNPTYDDTLSHGIYANQIGMGDVDIDIQGGSIETRGAYSYGVYGRLTKADHGGLLSIRTGGGHTITTTGKSGHGIVAYNYGTLPTSTTPINVGGNITTTGAGALSSGAPVRVAAIGDDGYRQQTVTVNGSVMGNAVGIFLAGGGRVVIGPRGSIGATSGIAILATGDTPGADPLDPLLKPKLRVDMNLGGRRVARAIGRNWIINDGGETTIAVNGVVLHEGATGVTGLTARNGAWNVRMREEGVNVTDYTDSDPANWVVSESAAGVVADRDFSAQDFNERRKPTPPPPMCPPGQVGTPPDCSVPEEPEPEPETGTPMLVEEYAPRAALYEVLPDFMLACKIGRQPGSVFSNRNRLYTSGSWGARDRKSSNARL